MLILLLSFSIQEGLIGGGAAIVEAFSNWTNLIEDVYDNETTEIRPGLKLFMIPITKCPH